MSLLFNFIDKVLIHPLAIIIQAIAKALPALIFCVIWIILSSIIATFLEKITKKILNVIKFNTFAERIQLHRLLPSFSASFDYSKPISIFIYWFVFFLLILSALSSLGFTPITLIIERFVLYIPRIFIAILLFVSGFILSNWLKYYIQNQPELSKSGYSNLYITFGKTFLIILFILLGIYELKILDEVILFIFKIILATLGLAIGIALGIGGKDIAQKMLNDLIFKKDENNKT
ncbi:MAG: hypothetical protein AB1765_01265 [Candidatus Hydrogenedentota bacterium]